MIDPLADAPRLLLSMGLRPRPGAPLRAVLRSLDPSTGRVVTLGTPPTAWHPTPTEDAELTGASWDGAHLLQCSRTTLLWLDPATGAALRTLHHPLFSDLHHAIRLPDGGLAVACTGHDSVLVLDDDGALREHHWLGHPDGRPRRADAGAVPEGFRAAYGTPDWSRQPFALTKPHRVHPNHLLWHRDHLWVTGLQDRRLRPVDGAEPGVLLPGPPHDGDRLPDGSLGLTTVDGHVLRLHPETLAVIDDLDLGKIDPSPRLPGWCRGLAQGGDMLYVGMTTLRASAHVEALRALWRGVAGRKRPTRVVAVHLPTRRVLASWPVGEGDEGTLYAITPSRPPTAAP